MKKVLIIVAHPAASSLTTKVGLEISNILLKNSNEVTLINLYDEENSLPFLTFKNKDELKVLSSRVKFFQKLILESNSVVFVSPVWWGGTPAILKNFIDSVFTKGFAYHYTEKGVSGHLQNIKASFVSLSGGPAFYYNFFLSPYHLGIKKNFIHFCGMKYGAISVFGKVDMVPIDSNKLSLFIEKVIKNV